MLMCLLTHSLVNFLLKFGSFLDQLSVMFAIIINTHLTASNNEKPVVRQMPTAEESNYEGSNLAMCFKIIQITLDLQQNGKVKHN